MAFPWSVPVPDTAADGSWAGFSAALQHGAGFLPWEALPFLLFGSEAMILPLLRQEDICQLQGRFKRIKKLGLAGLFRNEAGSCADFGHISFIGKGCYERFVRVSFYYKVTRAHFFL